MGSLCRSVVQRREGGIMKLVIIAVIFIVALLCSATSSPTPKEQGSGASQAIEAKEAGFKIDERFLIMHPGRNKREAEAGPTKSDGEEDVERAPPECGSCQRSSTFQQSMRMM